MENTIRTKKLNEVLDYDIIYDEKAKQSLHKLPPDIRKRIIVKLEQAMKNAFHYFSRLSEREEYKLRVGNYRVIADIKQHKRLIYVRLIDHRKKIYK